LGSARKFGELWSTNNKVAGADVGPLYVDCARSVYANAFDCGPRDFATG